MGDPDLHNRWRGPTVSEEERDRDETETGVIVKVLVDGMFQIRLKDNRYILGHLSSRMRLCPQRLLVGDRVQVQVASYDPSRGRILRRLNGE